MIDAAQARQVATSWVASSGAWCAPDDDPVLVEGATTEFNFGWVYYYDSRRFLETGDPRWALHGNAPFLIDRNDGSVHPVGTAVATAATISRYAEQWVAW